MNTRNLVSSIVVAMMALGASACKKKEAAAPGAPAAQPVAAPSAPVASAVVRNTIGVPACDEWLTKVESCMARSPAMKARYEAGYKVVNEAWAKNAKAGGATTAALPASCKTSLETLDAECKK
jgi:hypothetical protein